jgi:hypothetical protein
MQTCSEFRDKQEYYFEMLAPYLHPNPNNHPMLSAYYSIQLQLQEPFVSRTFLSSNTPTSVKITGFLGIVQRPEF